eukprot:6206633-Pleurochrysis_carterae.AAC.1
MAESQTQLPVFHRNTIWGATAAAAAEPNVFSGALLSAQFWSLVRQRERIEAGKGKAFASDPRI